MIINITFYAPVAVCYVILIVCFLLDLVVNIRRILKKRSSTEDAFTDSIKPKDTTANIYVKSLLTRESRKKPGNLVGKVKQKVTYENIPGLRYSPRVLCTMIVAGFALFKFGLQIGYIFDMYMEALLFYFTSYGPTLVEEFGDNNTEVLYDQILEGLRVTKVALMVSNGLSLVIHFIYMVLMALSYRRHLRLYIQGHRDWHHKTKGSPASTLVGSMRYSGYQIAFLIYGWFITFGLLLLIVMLFTYLIVLPLKNGTSSIAIDRIKSLWPTVIISMAILIGQKLLAKFVFLQEKGKYMALNNRRVFHVVSFFLFFFNILLGLFSALRRILISLIAGTMLLSRLDRVLMMRGLENMDSGFNSYLGMLQTEVHQTHPIMRCFIECLEKSVHSRHDDLNQAKDDEDLAARKKRHYRRVLANKWFKAVTLTNNPSILIERLNRLLADKATRNSQTESGLNEALERLHGNTMGPLIYPGLPRTTHKEHVNLSYENETPNGIVINGVDYSENQTKF